MKLTYQQIEDAVIALENYGPQVSFKTKLRLGRNLAKLTSAHHERQHLQNRLAYSHLLVKDKPAAQNQQGAIQLTPDEHAKFAPELLKLLKEETEVDIHQIELFDSEIGEVPNEPATAIDVSKTPMPNGVIARLIDIVFKEVTP